MKAKILTLITAAAIFSLGTSSILFAQETNTTTESHDHDHAVAPKSDAKKDAPSSDMMGGMHDCMGMKKMDSKTCKKDMMQKCQKEMSKGECHKMMKHAKSQGTSTKR